MGSSDGKSFAYLEIINWSAFYKNPQENHTAYAYTWIWPPRSQTVGVRASIQGYSCYESNTPSPRGKLDYRVSRICIKNNEIMPLVWKKTHTGRTNEITLKNENS